jgi:hypothetical protein
MEDIILDDDVTATVPEEVHELMEKLHRTCRGNRSDHVIDALWLLLIIVFMRCEECSFRDALKHAQELAESSTFGTREEAIAALSPPH